MHHYVDRREALRKTGPRVRLVSIGSWSEYVRIIEGWSGFRNWAFRGQAGAIVKSGVRRCCLCPVIDRSLLARHP